MVRPLPLLLTWLVCLAPSSLVAQANIPDTPAGHTLAAWIDAFNSGDRARIDAFLRSFAPNSPDSILGSAQFRAKSGGVTLVSIDRSRPLSLLFRLQEKTQPAVLFGRIDLTSSQPPAIASVALRAVPPGAVPDDLKLDSTARHLVIEDVLGALHDFYLDPAMAEKMAARLRARESHGDFTKIDDPDEFAAALTSGLVEVSQDKHLRIFYNPYKLAADPAPSTPDQVAEARQALSRDCGFKKLEVLPNNIGYLKLDFFPDMMSCGRTAAAAISFFANTDAVIFDLRENGGGDPRMVALLCSYLFDQRTHLSDLWERQNNQTTEYWTYRYVPGIRIGRKPVYILTSSKTFSGAEEFAYDLKALKRATVVGETTAGASHPVLPHRAGDHFTIYVPNGRFVNPITRTDWERTGVVPDVTVSAADALETARQLASGKIQETANHPDPPAAGAGALTQPLIEPLTQP